MNGQPRDRDRGAVQLVEQIPQGFDAAIIGNPQSQSVIIADGAAERMCRLFESPRIRELEFDVTAEQIERMHGPVGLKNGARTPPEIAVAILAEMTAVRYGYRIPEPVRL